MQALKPNQPLERRPLRDIDINRIRHPNIPSKNRPNTGKASILSGFQVFADGEFSSFSKQANVTIPCKSSVNDDKQTIGGKQHFQSSNGACDNHAIAKDIDVNVNSVSDCTVSKTDAQVAYTNWLEKQLALMQIEKKPDKNQVPIADKHDVEGITNGVSIVNPDYKWNKVSDNSAKQYEDNIFARSENLDKERELKSSDTGAIRKVAPNAASSTEFKKVPELPKSTLNVTAEEWKSTLSNTTKVAPFEYSTTGASSQSNNTVQQMPTLWNLHAHDVQTNQPDHYTDANGTYVHNFVTTVHPQGRKIAGRNFKSFENGQQRPTLCDSLKQLDDRSDEIARYHEYKKARRIKATEAMFLEQERLKRITAMNQNVSSSVGNEELHSKYPTECSNINDFQRKKHVSYKQVPTMSPSAERPGVKKCVCIIKYPTPPNVPIRYEPAELMNMNYASFKNQNKQARNEFQIKMNQKQKRTTNKEKFKK